MANTVNHQLFSHKQWTKQNEFKDRNQATEFLVLAASLSNDLGPGYNLFESQILQMWHEGILNVLRVLPSHLVKTFGNHVNPGRELFHLNSYSWEVFQGLGWRGVERNTGMAEGWGWRWQSSSVLFLDLLAYHRCHSVKGGISLPPLVFLQLNQCLALCRCSIHIQVNCNSLNMYLNRALS